MTGAPMIPGPLSEKAAHTFPYNYQTRRGHLKLPDRRPTAMEGGTLADPAQKAL